MNVLDLIAKLDEIATFLKVVSPQESSVVREASRIIQYNQSALMLLDGRELCRTGKNISISP